MNSDAQALQASLPPDAPELVAHMLGDLYLGLDTTIVVPAAEGCALLDEAAAQLARGRTRVLRVPAPSPGSLTLTGLLARLHPTTRGVEQAPEQGIGALTQLDPSCERIALLVSSAEALEHNTLRAIQIAAEAQPKLRLVLAGTPALLEILEHPDLSLLHGRLNRSIDLQDGDEDEPTVWDTSPVLAAPLKPAPANDEHRLIKIVAVATAVFATVGLGILVSHTGGDTAAITRPPAAQPTRAYTGPARPQAQSQAQTVPQDQPHTVAASRDVPAPPPAASSTPPQTFAAAPVASAPTAPAFTASEPASPALADPAQTRPEPHVASTVPPLAPATPTQSPAFVQQAWPSLLPKHREPTPRHLAAPAPRYASRLVGGIDQPGADQAFADPRLLQLKRDLSDRRSDPPPPVSDEPRQQQEGNAWPFPADQPRGTIGTYSSGPGGTRSFHYGS